MDASVGERELDVLSALWTHGAGTVADVRKRLPVVLAYNTVLTILRNLETKGLVGHTEEGRFHRYHSTVEQEHVRGRHVSRLVDKLFAGSPLDLLAHLVAHERVSTDDVRALHALLDARLRAAESVPMPHAPTPKARRRSDR